MQNLAGRKDCDITIRQELVRTGVEVVKGKRTDAEVPASITGKLGPFTFDRAWYYWCVAGPMPIAIARELYADPVGKTDIRASGDCACRAPDRWSEWTTEDGREVIPTSNETGLRKYLAVGFFKQSDFDKYVFSDDPASIGAKQYVTSYHIDSELGLYKFVEAIRRHKLA